MPFDTTKRQVWPCCVKLNPSTPVTEYYLRNVNVIYIFLDSPSVQMKHLQRHTHKHKRRTAATPHTEMRITMAGPTVAHKHISSHFLQNTDDV